MATNSRSTLLCSLCLAVGALSGGALNAADPHPSNPPRPYPERLQWWAEARFGMFIHWGPVSLKETEISWSRANTNPKCPNNGAIPAAVYDNLYKDFNPNNFDGAQWTRIAKAGGVKYMVLTAKHCDGFLLWPSKASDHNISATPFRRDICAELSSAARKQGLRIGWYFSPMDWRDPDFRTDRNPAFLGRIQAELRELLGNYGPIDVLWLDWDGREPLYDQVKTYEIVKALQPNIVINNRLDLASTNNDRQILSTNADYYTPEQSVGAYDDQRPWESCMTLSLRDQWSWGGSQDGVKSLEACLNMLVRCAGGDGNLLLNVGPMPNGEIAPEQANRLKEMGAWLSKCGESIYGTRGGPFKPGSYGASTRKGKTIYLHIRDWAGDRLKLPPIPVKILNSRILSGGSANVRQSDTGIEVSAAEGVRQPIVTVVALELDREANTLSAVDVPEPVSLTLNAKATASSIYQGQAEYGPEKAVDGKGDTRWATDKGLRQAWLELDLGKPVTFKHVRLSEAFPKRVQKFELQRLDGEEWKTFYTGKTIGESWAAQFGPVTAQRVRLNVTDATDGPTLWEFQLFQ